MDVELEEKVGFCGMGSGVLYEDEDCTIPVQLDEVLEYGIDLTRYNTIDGDIVYSSNYYVDVGIPYCVYKECLLELLGNNLEFFYVEQFSSTHYGLIMLQESLRNIE